jgi:hypothetical protein
VIRFDKLLPIAFAFSLPFLALPALAQFEASAMQKIPSPVWSIASGDFNRDGNLDLAIVSNKISVLLGNANGTFRPPVNYMPQGVGVSIVSADLNGDGILDLAVAALETNKVEVLLGNGDGTFKAPIASTTTGFPSFLAVGDFNGDHKLDLAIVDYPYISVLLGNGDGTFQSPADYSSFVGGHELAVGDFNNDHNQDLIVVGYGGSFGAGLFLGNGDGTLQSPINYSLPYTAENVALADLNHDGNLDAVIADMLDGVTVLLGDGKGGLEQAGTYATESSGQSVLICDLDRTGKLDLVLDTGPPYGITVLRGNGDGTFQSPQVYDIGSTGTPVIGDLNHDGKLDFALVNSLSTVTTALNTGTAVFSPSTPLAFARQVINTSSPDQFITLTNTGTTPLSVTSIVATGPFNTSNNCGSTVAAGANCRITVNFEPTTTGALNGAITLNDGASSKPQTILLSGLSTPLAITPAYLNFGSQRVGAQSPPLVVTVTNKSSASISFNHIDISGTDWKDFSIQSETCGAKLASGASCTITVVFTPTMTGKRHAFNYATIIGAPYPTPVTLVGTGT